MVTEMVRNVEFRKDYYMAQYANLIGYTDVVPYEITRHISEKTIEIREMRAIRDDSVKLEVIAGGFSGHVVDQHKQKWIIETDMFKAPVIARLHKDGYFHSMFGKHKLSDVARKFYDYNF